MTEEEKLQGGGRGDSAAYVGGDGVVGGGAEVFDIDVERLEVGDQGVLQRTAE